MGNKRPLLTAYTGEQLLNEFEEAVQKEHYDPVGLPATPYNIDEYREEIIRRLSRVGKHGGK